MKWGYFISLLLSVFFSLRIESLVLQWVVLEINILSVVPLIIRRITADRVSCRLKYFLSQGTASLILIFFFMVGVGVDNILQIVLLLKLGIPPFHGWVIRVLDSANPFTQWILFTTQKFIPINIIRSVTFRFSLFQLILLRTMVLLLFSYVYSMTRILFISSARNIIGVMIILVNRNLWMLYLLTYVIIVSVLIVFLASTSRYRFSSLAVTNPRVIFLFSIFLFNLGGIPPIAGFLLKLLSIKALLELGGLIVFMFLLISLLILRVYINVRYWAWRTSQPFLDIYLINKSNWLIDIIIMSIFVFSLVLYLYV